jgi:hypothetical protein
MSFKPANSAAKIRQSAKDLRRRVKAGLGLPTQSIPHTSIAASNAGYLPLSSSDSTAATPENIPEFFHTTSFARGAANGGKNTAWARLEIALRRLESCSGMFPPLRPAASALVDCVRNISVGDLNHPHSLWAQDHRDVLRKFVNAVKSTMTSHQTLQA